MSTKCFVISEIGEEKSITREIADLIFHLLVEPAVKSCGIEPTRSDQSNKYGSIISEMHKSIEESAFCIAILADNLNVYYEIGFALALQKPVIILKREQDKLPFDIGHLRSIVYTLELARRESIQSRIVETIERLRKDNWRDLKTQNALYNRQDSQRTIRFTGGQVLKNADSQQTG